MPIMHLGEWQVFSQVFSFNTYGSSLGITEEELTSHTVAVHPRSEHVSYRVKDW